MSISFHWSRCRRIIIFPHLPFFPPYPPPSFLRFLLGSNNLPLHLFLQLLSFNSLLVFLSVPHQFLHLPTILLQSLNLIFLPVHLLQYQFNFFQSRRQVCGCFHGQWILWPNHFYFCLENKSTFCVRFLKFFHHLKLNFKANMLIS